jgi:hypothetical protein
VIGQLLTRLADYQLRRRCELLESKILRLRVKASYEAQRADRAEGALGTVRALLRIRREQVQDLIAERDGLMEQLKEAVEGKP